jgi:hypothetical protein
LGLLLQYLYVIDSLLSLEICHEHARKRTVTEANDFVAASKKAPSEQPMLSLAASLAAVAQANAAAEMPNLPTNRLGTIRKVALLQAH